MKLFLLLYLYTSFAFALSDKKIREELDTFFDPKVDYSHTVARITDRDASAHVFKIWGEDPNLKFFRTGDQLNFSIPGVEAESCHAVVRSTEYDYIVIFVDDLSVCWPRDDHIRIGAILKITSITLAKRVKEASLYRVVLLRRREDYIAQLRDLTNFIWAYKEKRIQVAADFDKKILDIQKEKARALSYLSLKKRNSMTLQNELSYKLDQVEKDLKFFQIEKRELFSDRWFFDQDLGKPVKNRPQKLKKNESSYYRKLKL
jgi:hypothetical protein